MKLLSQIQSRLRSMPLFLRLAITFTLVTILSMVVSALFVRLVTLSDFTKYIQTRTASELGPRLASYYQANGGWQGIGAGEIRTMPAPPPERDTPLTLTLVDTGHEVVYSTSGDAPGTTVQGDVLVQSAPIMVEGQTVGYLIVEPSQASFNVRTPEGVFVDRFSNSVLASVLIAATIALTVGVISARSISGPIRALTTATSRLSRGELGYQVDVRSGDEIGQLAIAFNQMSADLAKAQELRQRLMADIAHELRSPFSVILGYAEALHDGKLSGLPEIYESLYVESRHLQRLIDDVRLLSLADAGELPLTREPVSPKVLMERMRAAFSTQAGQREVRLIVDADSELGMLNIDPDRMAQVLGNLIGNALRFTPAGGEIRLTASRTPSAIELRVEDTGVGISEEDLPHIFDRFYRGSESRHADRDESGLGLAIARSIVEAHGGSVRAERRNQGAAFIITLTDSTV